MTKINTTAENTASRKQMLRGIFKIFTAISFLSLIYIFTAGLFNSEKAPEKTLYTFDLSTLKNNEATYFKLAKRDVLIIKRQPKPIVYWANDPIYGCKLEFLNPFIKPICINIKYNINGYSADKNQQLTSPSYTVNMQNILFTTDWILTLYISDTL